MTAPKTRNWKADERPDFVGRKYELIVTGEVETGSSNQQPKLTDTVPPGFNPRIKMLDLRIESTGGPGDGQQKYRNAEYRETTNGRAFDEVEIFYDGEQIAKIKVGRPKSMREKGKPAKKKAVKKTSKKTTKKSAKKKATKKKSKKKAGRKKRL